MLVDRTCSILKAATEAGSEWALENPCDRGVPVAHGGRRDLYSDPRHGSIWQMPAVIELAQHASCHTATFPLCHFGADWQKFTTLMFTPGLQRLRELDGILCSHQTYKQRAGGAYSGWQVDLRGGGRLSTRVQHLPRQDVLPPQRRHAEPQQSPRSLPGSCAHERTRRLQPTDNGGAPTRLATKGDDRSSERQLLRQRCSDQRPRRSPSV